MSGEEHYARAPHLELNRLRLNGKKGRFELIKLKEEKVRDERTGKMRYPVEELGQQIDVIFLRIRRRVEEKLEGKPGPNTPRPAYSNEHNHKNETFALTTPYGTEYGTSNELRPRFPKLRTQQIVYAIYRNELVRLTVKGASLGSEAKAKDVMNFYTYIDSFEKNPNARDGKKDHFYDFMTELHTVEEVSDLGEYYAISFKRGHANTPVTMQQVAAAMRAVHEFVTESDDYYKAKIAARAPIEPEAIMHAEDGPVIEYPEEDADPDDTPF